MTRKPAEFGGELPIFIFTKVGKIIFWTIMTKILGTMPKKCPKKVGKSPVLKTKSGQKKIAILH